VRGSFASITAFKVFFVCGSFRDAATWKKLFSFWTIAKINYFDLRLSKIALMAILEVKKSLERIGTK